MDASRQEVENLAARWAAGGPELRRLFAESGAELLVVTAAGARPGRAGGEPGLYPGVRVEAEAIRGEGDIPVLYAHPPAFLVQHLSLVERGPVVEQATLEALWADLGLDRPEPEAEGPEAEPKRGALAVAPGADGPRPEAKQGTPAGGPGAGRAPPEAKQGLPAGGPGAGRVPPEAKQGLPAAGSASGRVPPETKQGLPAPGRAPPVWPELRAELAAPAGESVQAWFDLLARRLLGQAGLVVAGQSFRLVEIEFYLHRAGHEDPAVHRAPAQLATCGGWYFHREKAAKIGFTRKGLDLTFGRPGREYGGILIRAVQARGARPTVVDGPSRVVDAVLAAAGVRSVGELKQLAGFREDALASGGLVRLEPAGLERREIRTGPRIGLKPGRPFAGASYRYRILAELAAPGRRDLPGRLSEAPAPARPPAPAAAPAQRPSPAPAPTGAPPLTEADFEMLGL